MFSTIRPLRQSDKRWGFKPLGTQGQTLASAGCLISALASGFGQYGLDLRPDEMLVKLNQVNGILPSGELDTGTIVKAFPNICFRGRWDTDLMKDGNHSVMEYDWAMKKILRLIELGNPVYLAVDYPGFGTPGKADHFVTLVSNSWDIMDPADGQFHKLQDKYGDINKAIYGFLALVGPPISVDVGGDIKIGIAAWKAGMAKKGGPNTSTYINEILDSLL